tara:strand:+ start:692 stop:1186 length:495 start_codon:yes stop_codon:yes gene_type:complete
MDIFKDAETWVAIAFILFIIILLRFSWSRIVSALDNRAEMIKQELDEARNLREQAQSLLADYQRKKQNSEKEIATIIEKAKTETENNIQISLKNHKYLLSRRKKNAEEKIIQAKERVIQDIKESIVDISIDASKTLIKENFNDKHGKKLVDEASSNIDKDFIKL